ncbi:hypothetical protein BJ944DRAFT_242539 [Cunninghamella echinulata]|nr:hypothetical protein BJ944DRAFT_242539 [Cunninghamella echinulata]
MLAVNWYFPNTIQCYLQDTKRRPLCIGEKYGVINNQPIRYSSSHSGGEKSGSENMFKSIYNLGLTNNTIERAYNGGNSLDTYGLRGFTIVKIMDKTKSINKMCSDSDDDQVIMDVIAGATISRFFMTDEDNTVILKSSTFKREDPNYDNHFIHFKKYRWHVFYIN